MQFLYHKPGPGEIQRPNLPKRRAFLLTELLIIDRSPFEHIVG